MEKLEISPENMQMMDSEMSDAEIILIHYIKFHPLMEGIRNTTFNHLLKNYSNEKKVQKEQYKKDVQKKKNELKKAQNTKII